MPVLLNFTMRAEWFWCMRSLRATNVIGRYISTRNKILYRDVSEPGGVNYGYSLRSSELTIQFHSGLLEGGAESRD